MQQKILVVDDDRLMRHSLALHLADAGYDAHEAEDGIEALQLIETLHPDLVLLDIVMPGIDGHEVLRRFPNIPVIFVTGRRRELDELLGLELGADDYITKPFDIDILLARVKAVLRRTPSVLPGNEPQTVVVGDLEIDPTAHTVRVAGEPVELTPKEFDLLHYLARNAGQVLSVEQMLDHVWGEGWIGEEQTVYVHIRWLRKKLEENPRRPCRLVTVRRVGYKLEPICTESESQLNATQS